MVGGDVIDGVRLHGGCVDDDIAYELSVEVGFQAVIFIYVVRKGRPEVGVTVSDMDIRGVLAVDGDDGRG